jgi:5'-nucleotidase
MTQSVESNLVVTVDAGALFNLTSNGARRDAVCDGTPLGPGAAFPLVRRVLTLGQSAGSTAVRVVVVTRADSASGDEICASMTAHGLPSCQTVAASPIGPGLQARTLRSSLFLLTNADDVRDALACGVPAGCVSPVGVADDAIDDELRIAFDFDGVLADDAAERIFQQGGLGAFEEHEHRLSAQPLNPGPVARFCRDLNRLQRRLSGSRVAGAIRTAIVTSRGAPADARMMTTLLGLGLHVDAIHCLGGTPKAPLIKAIKPHMFFDDQRLHFNGLSPEVAGTHVPFGVTNPAANSWQTSM